MPQTHQTTVPDAEAVIARATADVLESHASDDATALRVQVTQAGREVTTLDVPASAIPLITAVLRELGAGKAVTVLGDDAEITTQEAANILNVSRPHLVGMVESRLLPARMVGNQRRLQLSDVLAYKAAQFADREAGLDELAAFSQEFSLL